MPRQIQVIVGKDGTARHIYSEEAIAITKTLGTQNIRRASNVEPTSELSEAAKEWLVHVGGFRQGIPNGGWWADLLVSGGPVLGPFDTREEALTAEANWLKEHNIPTCPTGTC